jgi:flagellar hook-basal body complex protein FliE
MKLLALSTINPYPELKSPEHLEKSGTEFGSWLKEQVRETNTLLLSADESLNALASGEAPSLHQTMLKLEEAKLSLQFLEQLRNRLMSAYQELLREQI